MRLPGEPAVMSVELFTVSSKDEEDAKRDCPDHVKFVDDPVLDFKHCYYCDNMWFPQTWRDDGRKKNSVARVSIGMLYGQDKLILHLICASIGMECRIQKLQLTL